MGLFWIRPDRFMPLDGTSQSMLKSLGITFDNTKFLLYSEYKSVMNRLDTKMQTESLGYTNYAEFSYTAWTLLDSNSKEDTKPNATGITYWMYAPGEQARFWDEYYQDGTMGLGWNKIGDLRDYRKQEDLIAPLKQNYGDDSSQKNVADMLYSFAYEMKPGDIVFAKKGRSMIVGTILRLMDGRQPASSMMGRNYTISANIPLRCAVMRTGVALSSVRTGHVNTFRLKWMMI